MPLPLFIFDFPIQTNSQLEIFKVEKSIHRLPPFSWATKCFSEIKFSYI